MGSYNLKFAINLSAKPLKSGQTLALIMETGYDRKNSNRVIGPVARKFLAQKP